MKPNVRRFGGSRSARGKVIALTLLAIAVSGVVMDRVAVSELRSVAHPDRRLEEAAKFGLERVVSPETAPTLRAALKVALGGVGAAAAAAA